MHVEKEEVEKAIVDFYKRLLEVADWGPKLGGLGFVILAGRRVNG